MDAFSEVLNGVRLQGALFFTAAFSAPWRLSTPHCRVLAATLAPDAPLNPTLHWWVEFVPYFATKSPLPPSGRSAPPKLTIPL